MYMHIHAYPCILVHINTKSQQVRYIKTFNAQQLQGLSKVDKLLANVCVGFPDVLFLQETRTDRDSVMDYFRMKADLRGFNLYYNGDTSILIRKSVLSSDEIEIRTFSSRFQAVRCQIPESTWLCNVYAPTGDDSNRTIFYRDLGEFLETIEMRSMIFGGDFNNVVDWLLDSQPPCDPEPSGRLLGRLVDRLNLCDSYRVLHPNENGYTNVPHANHKRRRRRLDRIYLSHGFKLARATIHAKPAYSSHSAYSVELESSQRRSKGYFILGAEITRNRSLCTAIVQFDVLFAANGNRSWDYFVCQSRRRSIQLSLCLKKLNPQEPDRGIPPSENPKYQDFRIGGTGLRQRFQRRVSQSLIDLKDTPLYVIHQRFGSFFAKIFEAKSSRGDAHKYLNEYGPKCLTSLERHNLDAEITVAELTSAFEKYSHPSSPGADGLPFEFYDQNWDTVAPILANTANFIMDHGALPESMKKVYIKLIHKGEDTTDPTNYRPISLLPIALRIISYTLNKRLMRAVDRVVGREQKGFLPTRQMHDAIHSVRSLVHYLTQRSPESAIPFEGLAFVDFQKAFDSVSHSYIEILLTYVNMGCRFKRFLLAVTTQQHAQLYVNYSIGIPFELKSGVRQGNPISPTLFVLALEPLLNELRSKVSGISFTKTIEFNVKLSVYADDVMICMRDQADHLAANTALTRFAEVSGLEVNRKKTQILHTVPGEYPDTIGKSLPLSENVTYLGVPIHGVDWSTEYGKIIRRLERTFYMDLPLATRSLAINVYIFSTVYFLDAHDPMPDEYITKLMQHVIRRLQGGGIKLSAKRIHTPCRLGGLGLIDLRFQLKGKRAKWIYQTLRQDEFPYRYFRTLIQEAITGSLACPQEGKHYSAAWFLCLLYSHPNRFRTQFKPAVWISRSELPRNLQSYLSAWFGIVQLWSKNTYKVDEVTRARLREFLLIGPIGKEIEDLPLSFRGLLPKGVSEVMTLLKDKRTRETGISAKTFHHRHSRFYRTKGNQPIIPTWAKDIQPLPETWRKIWGQIAKIQEQAPGAVESYYLFLHGNFHVRMNPRLIGGTRAENQPYASMPACALCLDSQESIQHMLQDCSVVKIFWAVISRELEDQDMNLETIVDGHNRGIKHIIGYNQLLSLTMFARTKRRYGSEAPRPQSAERWYRWIVQRTKLASCWRLVEQLREVI